MENRIATLTIFIESSDKIDEINRILTEYSGLIISRMGVPYREKRVAVIVLILDGTTDEIGALSGKLGNIKNISAKTIIKKS